MSTYSPNPRKAYGEDPYPDDWRERRHRVLKRDSFECQGCGYHPDEEGERQLHAHHLTPISEGGGHELENLLTLCKPCHQDVHSSDQEVPLEPIDYVECYVCDATYPKSEGVKGSFCSERCFAKKQAGHALNYMERNQTVCRTCFSQVEKFEGSCSRCNAWDVYSDLRGESGIEDYENVENLVLRVIQWYEFG